MMTKKEIDVVPLITLVDYKTVVYGNERDEHIRAVAFYYIFFDIRVFS